MEDKRFAHIATDPKFRRIPKNERKVKIDKRFQSMFKDKQFKVKYTVDKRGRPVNHSTTEDLKRYYELSDSEEESEKETGKSVKTPEPNNDLSKKLTTDKKVTDVIKNKLRDLNVDYARGESTLYSESSSDDEEEESGQELSADEEIEHKWGELDTDADKTEEATYRLAACNMNWDRIRAIDLMVLFNSFLPPGGVIKSVVIYPSEFGKKRIEEEEIKGPIELVENKDVEESEEGAKFHMEKLRQYQLNRLKYFYAVITFDNAKSANKVYTECDGMEYESSATKIDLRFIPDDMSFDETEAKEVCEKLPELNKYQPRFFTTTALQQAKVDLTWDETDLERIEMSQKLSTGKAEEISESDLQNYLALSSEEEEEVEDEKNAKQGNNDDEEKLDDVNPIDKYKALLQDIEDKEKEKKNKEIEMEVSWGIDLKNKTEDLVKKKLLDADDKTPFQKYLEKRKEKRKEKKQKQKQVEDEVNSDVPSDIDLNDPYFAEEFNTEEFKKKKKKTKTVGDNKNLDSETEDDQKNAQLELLLMNENEDSSKRHFSLKGIQQMETSGKSKKKRKNQMNEEKDLDEFQVNVDDERFSALFTSHHFNIDPTDPHYKKTKAMETLISEKIKRRQNDEVEKDSDRKRLKTDNRKKDAELSVLVKSVKRKTQALCNNSSRNK